MVLDELLSAVSTQALNNTHLGLSIEWFSFESEDIIGGEYERRERRK